MMEEKKPADLQLKPDDTMTPGPSHPDEKTTTIDELPAEILCPIVQQLSYKDRLKVTEVSSRWHSIVDDMLGRKLFVGRPCQFTTDDEERYKHHYVPINNLGKVGVNSCYVGEVVDPTTTMTNWAYMWSKVKETIWGNNLPKFKHAHLVKNIFFDGPLPSRYFDSIVRPLKNLERLDIHLSALSCLNTANMDLPPLNRLETLNIWGHKLTQGLFSQFYSNTQIIGNLLVLLNHNHFPSLKTLAMEYPFDLKEDSNKVTDSLLEFLKKHRKTLQKYKLFVNLFITEEPNDFDSAEDREWIQKARAASKLISLKNMELNITTIYRVRLSKIWNAFVEAQTSLDTVSVMTFRLEQNVMQRICQHNFKTMQSLSLTRLILNDNGRFTPVDCSVLENCSYLKSLALEGMPSGITMDAALLNVQCLPKSLEKLELTSLVTFKQDALYLLTELPNLQNVFFGEIGHQGEFGVSVETLERVIQDRKITYVTLFGCVNGKLPDEGIPNGDPETQVSIHLRYYGMLELKLNQRGYYECVPREPLPEMFVGDLD